MALLSKATSSYLQCFYSSFLAVSDELDVLLVVLWAGVVLLLAVVLRAVLLAAVDFAAVRLPAVPVDAFLVVLVDVV